MYVLKQFLIGLVFSSSKTQEAPWGFCFSVLFYCDKSGKIQKHLFIRQLTLHCNQNQDQSHENILDFFHVLF